MHTHALRCRFQSLNVPVHSQDTLLQMPEDEKGHKQLGRGHALSHLAQLGLTLLLGILVMAEPWPTVSAWRAVYGGFGIVYALQVSCFRKEKFVTQVPSTWA